MAKKRVKKKPGKSAKRPKKVAKSKKAPARRPARKAAKPARKAAKRAKPAGKKRGLVPVPTQRTPPSSLDMDRTATAARSGRRVMNENQRRHNKMSAVTGGDV